MIRNLKQMALLDTPVLVHAAHSSTPLHERAARLVQRGLDKRGRYCIAPQNLIEFAAVVSRARFVERPLSGPDILRIANLLYASRRLTKIYPQRGTVIRSVREGAALGIIGPIWYDLFLATTMQDAGVSVVVTESVNDFRRFPFITTLTIQEAYERAGNS